MLSKQTAPRCCSLRTCLPQEPTGAASGAAVPVGQAPTCSCTGALAAPLGSEPAPHMLGAIYTLCALKSQTHCVVNSEIRTSVILIAVTFILKVACVDLHLFCNSLKSEVIHSSE